ncbi:MAG: glycosyltransferase [Polaribacter sp.]|uniref:glycosyltransferase n=1 Tax=Polaribacter sp. TaxID=1920175 RepID=UPI003EF620AD
MKIGFFLVQIAIVSGDSNGVKGQARGWAEGLKSRGHIVEELDVWDNYDWKTFDIIHIFGTGIWLHNFVKVLSKKNNNIVVSPIIDSIQTPFKYKISTFFGLEKLRLSSPTYALKKSLPYIKAVFVRSDYESLFFSESMNLSSAKIFKVPLSFDEGICKVYNQKVEKENFCLHISSIYQERKNVIRLIKAAKKYRFNLVLAGAKGTTEQFLPILKEIGDAKNIKVLGFITEEEMIDLYKKAKVFALPSISEGVGIVALNAAYYGCEVVITNIGGPNEYFKPFAELVSPYSVDEIGAAVNKLLIKKENRNLEKHIFKNFNEAIIAKEIEKAYSQILNNNK